MDLQQSRLRRAEGRSAGERLRRGREGWRGEREDPAAVGGSGGEDALVTRVGIWWWGWGGEAGVFGAEGGGEPTRADARNARAPRQRSSCQLAAGVSANKFPKGQNATLLNGTEGQGCMLSHSSMHVHATNF